MDAKQQPGPFHPFRFVTQSAADNDDDPLFQPTNEQAQKIAALKSSSLPRGVLVLVETIPEEELIPSIAPNLNTWVLAPGSSCWHLARLVSKITPYFAR